MATPAYSTHALTAHATVDPYVMDKPSGLAVGDLMIAHIYTYATSAAVQMTITPPEDWATLQEVGSTAELMGLYAKIADADDVAAANFSFTINGAGGWRERGAIVRVTANSEFDLSLLQSHATFDGSAGTNFLDTGLTPNFAAGLYLILVGQDAAVGRSVASYAMATDNPSWTEAYDSATGAEANVAMAYGTRSSSNATGNVTATASGSVDNLATAIIFIPSITIVAPDALTITASLGPAIMPTVVVDEPATLTVSPVSPTVTMPGLSWSNPDKSSPSWSNPDKTL